MRESRGGTRKGRQQGSSVASASNDDVEEKDGNDRWAMSGSVEDPYKRNCLWCWKAFAARKETVSNIGPHTGGIGPENGGFFGGSACIRSDTHTQEKQTVSKI